jgi:hypothetical protein
MLHRMWLVFFVTAAALICATPAAHAQTSSPAVSEQVTFEPGFSFLRVFGETGVGFSGYVNDPFRRLQSGGTLGVVGGVGFHNFDLERDLNVQGGVRFTLKSQNKITPFVQGLAGLAHSTGKDCFAACSESNFEAGGGGGVFVALTPRVHGEASILLDFRRSDSAGEIREVGGIIGIGIFTGIAPLIGK